MLDKCQSLGSLDLLIGRWLKTIGLTYGCEKLKLSLLSGARNSDPSHPLVLPFRVFQPLSNLCSLTAGEADRLVGILNLRLLKPTGCNRLESVTSLVLGTSSGFVGVKERRKWPYWVTSDSLKLRNTPITSPAFREQRLSINPWTVQGYSGSETYRARLRAMLRLAVAKDRRYLPTGQQMENDCSLNGRKRGWTAFDALEVSACNLKEMRRPRAHNLGNTRKAGSNPAASTQGTAVFSLFSL